MPLERFPLDAAIIFADLMTPVAALGCDVRFEPGPVLVAPAAQRGATSRAARPSPDEIAPEVRGGAPQREARARRPRGAARLRGRAVVDRGVPGPGAAATRDSRRCGRSPRRTRTRRRAARPAHGPRGALPARAGGCGRRRGADLRHLGRAAVAGGLDARACARTWCASSTRRQSSASRASCSCRTRRTSWTPTRRCPPRGWPWTGARI